MDAVICRFFDIFMARIILRCNASFGCPCIATGPATVLDKLVITQYTPSGGGQPASTPFNCPCFRSSIAGHQPHVSRLHKISITLQHTTPIQCQQNPAIAAPNSQRPPSMQLKAAWYIFSQHQHQQKTGQHSSLQKAVPNLATASASSRNIARPQLASRAYPHHQGTGSIELRTQSRANARDGGSISGQVAQCRSKRHMQHPGTKEAALCCREEQQATVDRMGSPLNLGGEGGQRSSQSASKKAPKTRKEYADKVHNPASRDKLAVTKPHEKSGKCGHIGLPSYRDLSIAIHLESRHHRIHPR
ncbi:hypothetical protein Nepgr_023031 [Nepenthes gracilis]|uniref:Uncharacterized protein n=1 Tax=Nepenthes gracilis TaxID=150966 RepID=A0AAD3T1V6_NEPGR|nr:hypothetical protein Nepgr_023031 [Nepenthes gracilis]